MRKAAQRRLPKPIFDYIEGGADDERSLRRNSSAFDDFELLPNHLNDVASIDTATTVLGRRISMPLMLAPTATSRLFHRDAELGVANAAARHDIYYGLSTLATTSIEDVGAAASGPKMFQIYILRDRGLTREFVARCKAARYDALCLTVDTPVAGNRERDRVSGMTVPPRFTAKSALSFASHPRWLLDMLLGPKFRFANVSQQTPEGQTGSTTSFVEYINRQFDRSVTWKDVAWLATEWGGPLAIKGLQSPGDARRALEAGATAVMISNHGGRQLEDSPAPIDCLVPMRQAVGSALELIVDGGIRRGTHILKALALGANACSIGRPYLYALGAGGRAGVDHLLNLLRAEIERDLALIGVRSVSDLGAHHALSRRPAG